MGEPKILFPNAGFNFLCVFSSLGTWKAPFCGTDLSLVIKEPVH